MINSVTTPELQVIQLTRQIQNLKQRIKGIVTNSRKAEKAVDRLKADFTIELLEISNEVKNQSKFDIFGKTKKAILQRIKKKLKELPKY